MRRLSLLLCLLISAFASFAEEEPANPVILPIDRAAILAGSKFDLKIEFPTIIDAASAKVTINEKTIEQFFGKPATFIEKEDTGADPKNYDEEAGKPLDADKIPKASALLLRDCVIDTPGTYTVKASDGETKAQVTWEVYQTAEKRVAKNVILMIGDGMNVAHRTAARVMSKGIYQGKYKGKLAMEDMPKMALIGTSGVDNILTDSANSASAYTTGHKTSNAALGVYADRTKSALDDPRVEILSTLARRMNNMGVGVVTTTEIQDATPASMVSHTRSRGEKAAITDFFLEVKPDVVMGGGLAICMSKVGPGGKLNPTDYLSRFQDSGYTVLKTAGDLAAVSDGKSNKLLGLFNAGNMDGVLDRKFLKKGTVDRYPEQPDLVDMVKTALNTLSKNDNGFVLMIESGLIDKFSHRLDWERSVYETIMFDQAVAVVKEFAEKRGDTLVMITSDHGHGCGIAGVTDDNRKVHSSLMRDKVGGGYPNYVDADKDGYPDSVDVSKRLAFFYSAFPDHYETFRPKLNGPFDPVKLDARLPPTFVANDKYKNEPGAMLREGNINRSAGAGSHCVDDVVLFAMGPGSENIHGFMDNTEVFRTIANALSLGTHGDAKSQAPNSKQ